MRTLDSIVFKYNNLAEDDAITLGYGFDPAVRIANVSVHQYAHERDHPPDYDRREVSFRVWEPGCESDLATRGRNSMLMQETVVGLKRKAQFV